MTEAESPQQRRERIRLQVQSKLDQAGLSADMTDWIVDMAESVMQTPRNKIAAYAVALAEGLRFHRLSTSTTLCHCLINMMGFELFLATHDLGPGAKADGDLDPEDDHG